jgi:hypothetical protein
MIKWIIGFILIGTYQVGSCQQLDLTDKTAIDGFIKKYQDEQFAEFDRIIISAIEGNEKEMDYAIGKIENNLPLYFVTYDFVNKKIKDINRSVLDSAHVKDYFTDKELEKLILAFRKFNFSYLGKNEEGDVFVVPSPAHKPPFLLRVKNRTGDQVVKLGLTYKRYKDNWYITEH